VKLRARRLLVEGGAVQRFVALVALFEGGGILCEIPTGHQCDLVADVAFHIHVDPEIRMPRIGKLKLAIIVHRFFAIDIQIDPLWIEGVFDGNIEIFLSHLHREPYLAPRLLIALGNAVDIDVPPASRGIINDLDPSALPDQVGHIPIGPLQLLLVRAGLRPNHHTIDQEVNAGLSLMVSAADEEIDVFALDRELRACERADRWVSAKV